jgi:hypothetical protein
MANWNMIWELPCLCCTPLQGEDGLVGEHPKPNHCHRLPGRQSANQNKRARAIPAAFLASMLAQQQSVLGIEDANIKLIPLHIHFSSDPTLRQAVVGGISTSTIDGVDLRS